jgi:hypothetical protein
MFPSQEAPAKGRKCDLSTVKIIAAVFDQTPVSYETVTVFNYGRCNTEL